MKERSATVHGGVAALPAALICLVAVWLTASASPAAATSSGPRDLTVSKAGTGSGVVASGPAGIDCGTTCSASFVEGTEVILTATPDAASDFAGWSGSDCDGIGTCVVTMNEVRNVTATFTREPAPAKTTLTIKAPAKVAKGAKIEVAGRLTSPLPGCVKRQVLVVQRDGEEAGTATTKADGTYRFVFDVAETSEAKNVVVRVVFAGTATCKAGASRKEIVKLTLPDGGAGAAAVALQMVGKPYVWAGTKPSVGFDCSGLTSYAWSRVGVDLPHSSVRQYRAVRKISRSKLQVGDLLFWYRDHHHVSIYVGNGKMVHARSSVGRVVVGKVAAYQDLGAPLTGIGRPG